MGFKSPIYIISKVLSQHPPSKPKVYFMLFHYSLSLQRPYKNNTPLVGIHAYN